MKLVHISDIHINPETILDHDPVANFKACLAHVEAHDADADAIVISGDLTHRGDAQSYQMLIDILAASPLKPRLMIGNHDIRGNFAAAFPDSPRDADGFIQWTESTPAGLFVYMDSVDEGRHSGLYCASRQAWLSAVLSEARAAGQKAWLFMHHNPVRVHVANADVIGFANEAELQALLAVNRDVIAHMFFGHCHYSLSGTMAGIPFSAPRSTNHVCWPDFSGVIERMGHGDLAPNYNVCFLEAGSTVVHSVDFGDAPKVKWKIESFAELN